MVPRFAELLVNIDHIQGINELAGRYRDNLTSACQGAANALDGYAMGKVN
jgi:hypothetical protein